MSFVDQRPAEAISREQSMLMLLHQVWTFSFTTKSDTARDYADVIAEAASRGFITSETLPGRGHYGRLWKISRSGLTWLYALASRIEEVTDYVQDA